MAPTAMGKLISERDAVNDTINRIVRKVKAHPTSPILQEMCKILIEEVASAKADLKSVHTRIREQIPKADEMELHKTAYFDLADLTDQLHNFLHGIFAAFPVTVGTAPTVKKPIRLPILELKTFDGDLQEWISFRDMFLSSVHNDASLSKVQKMTYLKTLIRGEAAKQLQSLLLSDANYDSAWQQLHDRYQNPRDMLFSIMSRFYNQKIQQVSPTVIRSIVDTSKECIRSMEVLSLNSDKTSEAMMLFTIVTKLDSGSRELWEQTQKGSRIPPLSELFDFLEQRARALAAGGPNKPTQNESKRVHAHHGQSNQKCKTCLDSKHPMYKCSKFISMNVPERIETTRKHNLCNNCLWEGHFSSNCSSSSRCKSCNGRHHTLLHRPAVTDANSSGSSSSAVVLGHHSREEIKTSHGMLATAIIRVVGGDGQLQHCRALLDGGSTATFISERCCRRLGLRTSKNHAEVIGLAAMPIGTARGVTSVVFHPHFTTSQRYVVNALVLPKVTGKLPLESCNPSGWSHLNGITLADPEFHQKSSVDILLGSDIFWNLLSSGRRVATPGTPIGIASSLGWLVAGRVDSNSSKVVVNYSDSSLEAKLQSFWEVEAGSLLRTQTSEEIKCVADFAAHYSRDESGRYKVALPLKEPRPALGSSRDMALRRLYQLERRLSKNPAVQHQYKEFMNEYLTLGHMSSVPSAEVNHPQNPTYFIPHHFVVKEESTTTKLRVVFDASAKTTTGNSLNDGMLTGPTLQDSLVDIVIRFRTHPIAFTADIAKMYRQIRVPLPHADLQRILWRDSSTEEVKEYRLDTVTYGTSSAPYLAVKVLQQLAKDESTLFPLASAVCLQDFYVDDLIGGSTTVDKAIFLQQQLRALMERGGFSLRKWTSNSQQLLDSLPEVLREFQPHLDILIDPLVKTLGIRWNTRQDRFEFRYSDPIQSSNIYTKRKILSEISQLFDPLGRLSPIVLRAKILMQTLWGIQADWDEILLNEIQEYWMDMKKDLQNIDQITIPRCILPRKPVTCELVGFSDASEQAYGGVVYLRALYEDNCLVFLISSKTRVAPIKKMSLPRLELCGAVLLAELLDSVKTALKLDISKTTAWTDSTVVLAWIQAKPSKWKTFVANRVTSIQNNLPSSNWYHVPGKDNPADICSRGLSAEALSINSLWWNGPSWLSSHMSFNPNRSESPVSDPEALLMEERKIEICHISNINQRADLELLHRYSSIKRLQRITALLFRFKNNCQQPLHQRRTSPLTPSELDDALRRWIGICQQQHFLTEISCLKGKQTLSPKSAILALNPFLDPEGLLRVGGRLKNAEIPQDQKTPLLIPRHSQLTQLLISSAHLEHHHAGPSLLLAILQQRFWIIRSRDAVRYHVKKCVTCMRQTATTLRQFMGDLPASRVTSCRAFQRCGVDYAGPFLVRPDLKRSKTTIKSYLALFVCFSTRAFHLEVVSSLSTEAFLAALRRFVSRRGRPTDIYSDNGTNFVGANKELREMLALVKSRNHNIQVSNSIANEGINWHFNPPGAPHFGGLWEAGVKSVKFHLNRIIGSTRLTFEELTTIMYQIEACLNSRPLTPLSSDPSDLTALTSGHFLIGESLLAIPEPDLSSLPQNRLSDGS